MTQYKPGGTFRRVIWDPERRRRSYKSLQTTDRAEAQGRAEAFLEAVVRGQEPHAPDSLTLEDLWNHYHQEAASYQDNTPRTQAHKRGAVRRLLAFLGPRKRVEHLTRNDVERYAVARRSGRGWPDGRVVQPVRANAVRHDLGVLRTMILWATGERRGDGSWLLAENPLRGVKLPREEDPIRPVASFDRFIKLRAAMEHLAATAPQERGRQRWRRVDLALVLAEATGRRIGAIRGLRWSDIKSDPPSIHWRAEFDKRRRDQVVPIPRELAEELHRFRVRLGTVGDDWMFPCAQKDAPWPRELFRQLLVRAEQHAGLEHLKGGLWHAYRRKWTTEREELPLKALMVTGGWSDPATVLKCYFQPTSETLLKVMAHPVKLRERGAAGNA